MATPPPHRGLRHLALRVTDLKKSRAFYERLFGMKVVWEPDPDNVYFSSGCDILALHQISEAELADYHRGRGQFLDHVGVIMEDPAAVDELYALVAGEATELGATIVKPPKQHRDGSYSFYVADPDGNVVQVLYEPTISPLEFTGKESSLNRPPRS
ncbi:MAG TPA: VOC family protein [Nitrospiraceae bacterium]|nr:VOC family protein [Nitrospiraceae bacterium]